MLNDGSRQARLNALDAVLHLDRSGRGIRAGNEIGDDFDLAERVAGGFEIEDAVGAIELFLDQPRDAVVKVLGRGAWITGGDRNRRRRDDRILGHRQERDGEQSAKADQKGDDPSEHGPIDKEGGHRSEPSVW
jgi:hypothetical protein